MDGPRLLKEWRDGQGLTQEKAASLIGVHQNSWCDWETGAKQPRINTAIKIAALTKGYVPVQAWAKPDAGDDGIRHTDAKGAA